MALSQQEELELLELEEQEYQDSIKTSVPTQKKEPGFMESITPPMKPSDISSASLPLWIGKGGIPTSPLTSPIGMGLERAGRKVKGAVQDVISRGTSKAAEFGVPVPVAAVGGTIASTLTDVAPFTPQELAVNIGGEVLPAAMGSLANNQTVISLLKRLPESIANRFLKTPPSIAKARLERGEGTTGEAFLKNESLNPPAATNIENFIERLGSLPSSDKKVIWDVSRQRISELGNQIEQEADRLFKAGMTPDDIPIGPQGKPLALEYNPTPMRGGPTAPNPSPSLTAGRVGMEYVDPKVGTIGGFTGENAIKTSGTTRDYVNGKLVTTKGERYFDKASGYRKRSQSGALGNSDISGGFSDVAEFQRFLNKGAARIASEKASGVSEFKKAGGIDKSQLGTRGEVINNVIDEMKKTIEEWDPTGESVGLLNRVKNNKVLDFKTANDFRQALGEYVGKRFEREEVPEKIEAMIHIFGKLRQKIGSISPKIDALLKQQHDFFDIKNSVAKEAGMGYENLPHGVIDVLTIPFRSPKVASVLKASSETRGLGGLGIPTIKKYEKR